jgi:hypothetical protein
MSVVDQLVRARETYEQRDWARAFATWSDLEPEALTADDLAGLATAAYLLGNRVDAVAAMQRCFQLRVAQDDGPAAARTAFWLAVIHASGGEPALAGGWTARAQRLLENHEVDVVERGYVLVVQMFAHVAQGQFEAVAECAEAITDYDGGSTTPTCSRPDSPRAAGSWSNSVKSRRASPCSTRRWCASPTAVARRSWPARPTAR